MCAIIECYSLLFVLVPNMLRETAARYKALVYFIFVVGASASQRKYDGSTLLYDPKVLAVG